MKKFFESQHLEESRDSEQFKEKVLQKLAKVEATLNPQTIDDTTSRIVAVNASALVQQGKDPLSDPQVRYVVQSQYESLLKLMFQQLKEIDKFKELDALLDCCSLGRHEIVNVCLFLACGSRIYDMIQFLNIVAQDDHRKIQKIVQFAIQRNWEKVLQEINNNNSDDPFSDFEETNALLDNSLAHTSLAGLAKPQAQDVNKQMIVSQIDIQTDKEKKLQAAKIELIKKREEHNEELRFEREKSEILGNNISLGENSSNNVTVDIDYYELEKEIVIDKNMVRVFNGDDYDIFHYEEKKARHEAYPSKKNLCTVVTSYIYEKYGDRVEVSNTQIDAMVNRMFHNSVPILGEENSLVEIPKETVCFFKDGYYDSASKKFIRCDTRNYFHTSCLPCNFCQYVPMKIGFDKILKRIFANDVAKITLIYQIIGAIISNIAMKLVFLFQGIPDSGKSTLEEIIACLLYADEVKYIGSMNEINENRASSFEKKIKLLLIDDAPNQAWSNSTVSYLKTRSRGINNNSTSNFKILVGTNYPIKFKTEDGTDPSMENRIIVVPFTNNLKNDQADNQIGMIADYIRNTLPEERPIILRKALESLNEVLDNNGKFITKFKLNESVENSTIVKKSSQTTLNNAKKDKTEKLQLIQEIIMEQFDFVEKNEFESNVKSGMLAKDVQDVINEENPDLIPRTAELGKILKSLYEKDFVSKEYADKTYYNLKFTAE